MENISSDIVMSPGSFCKNRDNLPAVHKDFWNNVFFKKTLTSWPIATMFASSLLGETGLISRIGASASCFTAESETFVSRKICNAKQTSAAESRVKWQRSKCSDPPEWVADPLVFVACGIDKCGTGGRGLEIETTEELTY